MKAKEGITMTNVYGSELGDSCYRSRVISMNDSWRELTNIACRYLEDYNEVMEWISKRKAELWAKQEAQFRASEAGMEPRNYNVKDPRRVRTKGCGAASSSKRGKVKRVVRCSYCRVEGHNCRNCPKRPRNKDNESFGRGGNIVAEEEDDWDNGADLEDHDMVSDF